MTASAVALAAVSALVFVAAGAAVSIAVKEVCFASWRGSPAVVTVALIGTCWALAVGQLLGAVGWLRPAPLVGAALVSAAVAVLAGVRPRVAGPEPPASGGGVPAPPAPAAPQARPALLVATVLVVLGVAAIWVARTVIAVRRGIYDPDSLGYHLPFAATFAQTGHADPTRFGFPTSPVQFFPANDELLAAMALVLTKSVAFAAVKNLLYGGLVLVAAHAVGKAHGAALVAVGATAVVLGLPVVAFSQPGEAVNDIFPVFALLGGVAILAHARDRPAPYVLALACAGVAYGAKYSAVLPALALGGFALCLLAARVPAHRLRTAAVGAAASLAMGGSWYLRNAVKYGNPVPPADLGIGSLRLRSIITEAAPDAYSVAWYLVRGRALGDFRSGLGLGFGPLAALVLAALAVGGIAGLRSRDGFRRGLGALALLTAAGYVSLPGSAYGGGGTPGAFVVNLHYAIPALVVGAVAAAVAVGTSRWAWVLPAAGVVVVAVGLDPYRRGVVWAPELGGRGFAVLAAAAVVGAVVAWSSTRPGRPGLGRAGVVVTAAIAVVGVVVTARQYPRFPEADSLQRWAADAAPTAIGGWVPPAGLLYGPGATNQVVTLTRDRSVDGGPVVLDSCPQWMQALVDGRFPYSGVISGSKWQAWLDADPAFELVARNDVAAFYPIAVYRVTGRPDPACPGGG